MQLPHISLSLAFICVRYSFSSATYDSLESRVNARERRKKVETVRSRNEPSQAAAIESIGTDALAHLPASRPFAWCSLAERIKLITGKRAWKSAPWATFAGFTFLSAAARAQHIREASVSAVAFQFSPRPSAEKKHLAHHHRPSHRAPDQQKPADCNFRQNVRVILCVASFRASFSHRANLVKLVFLLAFWIYWQTFFAFSHHKSHLFYLIKELGGHKYIGTKYNRIK